MEDLIKENNKEEKLSSTFVYSVKKASGIKVSKDEFNDIIKDEEVEKLINGTPSEFSSRLTMNDFKFVLYINRKANIFMTNLSILSKYQRLVREALKQFEVAETLTQSGKQKTLGTITSK